VLYSERGIGQPPDTHPMTWNGGGMVRGNFVSASKEARSVCMSAANGCHRSPRRSLGECIMCCVKRAQA